LTAAGIRAIEGSCTSVATGELGSIEATVDLNSIGRASQVEIAFAAGICNPAATSVYLDGEQIISLADQD
jgi:hypothetical protein